jgi:hypothetical protein
MTTRTNNGKNKQLQKKQIPFGDDNQKKQRQKQEQATAKHTTGADGAGRHYYRESSCAASPLIAISTGSCWDSC